MPFQAYIKFPSKNRGVLEGFTGEDDKTFADGPVKKFSRVQAVNHSIRVPTQQQTGESQGTSSHSPMMVTVELDKSVAELYKCMSENGILSEVKIYFFRSGSGPRAAGTPTETLHNWFTITLKDARLVGMDLRKAFTMEGVNVPDLMDISMTYYEIKWEDHDDNKEADYKWNAKSGGK